LPPEEKTILLETIGEARSRIRQAGPHSSILPPGERGEEEELQRAAHLARIRHILEDIPYTALRDGILTVEDDIFLECLIMSLKNDLTSYQSFVSKMSYKSIQVVKEELELLKNRNEINNPPLENRIFELEKYICVSNDVAMRREIDKFANFETLHNEKLTPYFMKLARGSKSVANMECIRDDSASLFESDDGRKKFIYNYYRDLYRNKLPAGIMLNGCIDDFLGEEIVRNPLVVNSVIDRNMRDRLDNDLTAEELDEAILQANKSSPGLDGISNCFI
jgi:hypothetical protein